METEGTGRKRLREGRCVWAERLFKQVWFKFFNMGFQGVVVYQSGDYALSGDAEAGGIGGYADGFFQRVAFDQEGGQGGDKGVCTAGGVYGNKVGGREVFCGFCGFQVAAFVSKGYDEIGRASCRERV